MILKSHEILYILKKCPLKFPDSRFSKSPEARKIIGDYIIKPNVLENEYVDVLTCANGVIFEKAKELRESYWADRPKINKKKKTMAKSPDTYQLRWHCPIFNEF